MISRFSDEFITEDAENVWDNQKRCIYGWTFEGELIVTGVYGIGETNSQECIPEQCNQHTNWTVLLKKWYEISIFKDFEIKKRKERLTKFQKGHVYSQRSLRTANRLLPKSL